MNLFIYLVIKLFLFICNIEIEIINKCKKMHPIAICNHITKLDPLIMYMVLYILHSKYRFISDIDIKKIPIIYNFAKQYKTIFITRDENGFEKIKKKIKPNDNIFIFPEGYLYHKTTVIKSNDLCKKLNIKNFNNTLCPKNKGFNFISKILKPKKISDFTLKYQFKNNIGLKDIEKPITINNFFKFMPSKIIVVIEEKKIDYKDVNTVTNLFREKDLLLDKL